MDSKIVCFCLIFMQCSVQIRSLECPQCLDFKFKYFGMEGISQSQMDDILKSFGNVLCETNYEKPTTCNVATYGSTSKCSDVFETVVIKGMKGYDANAGLRVVSVSRGCTSRPNNEVDRCIDFTDSDEYSALEIKAKLDLFKDMFDTRSR